MTGRVRQSQMMLVISAMTAAWLCVPANAHDIPIKPVLAVASVEPDRLVVDLTGDSVYWAAEVLEADPLPPTPWSETLVARAEKYVNAHLRLTVDGRPIAGRLTNAQFFQKPWEVESEGQVRFRVEYPPLPRGARVAGAADFFAEANADRKGEGETPLPNTDFLTRWRVAGHPDLNADLTSPSITFAFDADAARRGKFSRALAALSAGASAVAGETAGWVCIVAIALTLTAAPSAQEIVLLAAGYFLGGLRPNGSATIAYAAGAVAAINAGWNTRSRTTTAALCLTAAATRWSFDAWTWLPRAAPSALDRFFGAVGGLLVLTAALLILFLIAESDRRAQREQSRAHAGELSQRRVRLAATVLLIISAVGLGRGLRG